MLVRAQGRTGHAFAADMSLLVFLVNFGPKPFLQAQPKQSGTLPPNSLQWLRHWMSVMAPPCRLLACLTLTMRLGQKWRTTWRRTLTLLRLCKTLPRTPKPWEAGCRLRPVRLEVLLIASHSTDVFIPWAVCCEEWFVHTTGHCRALQHQALQWWHSSPRQSQVFGVWCRVFCLQLMLGVCLWLPVVTCVMGFQLIRGAPFAFKNCFLWSCFRLGPIFEDIKKNGMEAAMKYYQDEELMLKISQKMGGLPSELSPVLQKIEDIRRFFLMKYTWYIIIYFMKLFMIGRIVVVVSKSTAMSHVVLCFLVLGC